MIDVRNLSKDFKVHRKEPGLMGSVRSLLRRQETVKHAVKSVSFQIGEGEIVGLVGANGAGKTTIVKMLAGIIHPSGGDATVLGYRPWTRDNRLRRQVALIMGQKAQLWWDLPAADCFLLLREIYQVPKDRHQHAIDELSEVLGVRDLLNVQVRRLSLGERMKMELMAALLHSPRVVYLDEPTIGLDLSAQRAVRDFLLRYQAQYRPAMILTSHYMEDIERLCKRILIIRDGEIVHDGSLEGVVTRYARHKVVTARVGEDSPNEQPAAAFHDLGTVLECTRDVVRLQVPRDSVAAAVSALVDRLSVVDISIEEVEIGTIIERIMSRPESPSP